MRTIPATILLILLLLIALPPPPPSAMALTADGLALLAFKAAVTEDPTSALSSWSESDADPCRWSGVTCANISSAQPQQPPQPRVVGLAVAGKNVSGYIPSELGSLLFLRRLNLHDNRLTGAIPAALSNASSLHSLFLYNNALTGVLPVAALCSGLPRLRNLDISSNALSGELPLELRGCRGLQRLVLSGNRFSGEVPGGIWPEMAPSLQQLDISSNTFNGSVPPSLGMLGKLFGTLNLSHNEFSGVVPPELGRLPAAVALDLRFNNLSGAIPQMGSLASQGPTAFLNNPALCGFPLQVACRAVPPPTLSPAPPQNTSPSTAAAAADQGRQHHPIKTNLIALISVADAAGVALVGVILVYIYWKVKDRKKSRDHDDEDDEDRKQGLCRCMWARRGRGGSRDESDDGGSSDDDEEEAGVRKQGGGGGDGELVAIDKGFRVELDELLRSSAYVLGKGGKGIVYKVVVGNGTTPVAVRRLGGGSAAHERYKEFAAEAGAIGRVRHANVVRLRAYYWSPDEKLVVTDFVNNGNLAKGAARGLAHLHECSPRRYVHGEVKPSNVLLDSDYNALLADFGLARLLTIAGCSADHSANANAGMMGCALPYVKPAAPDRPNAYRAPEARVPGARPSQKSDVYSFGVLLLELLTGRSPDHQAASASFSGDGGQQQQQEPEIVRWVRQGFEDARPLSELADEAVLRDAGARKEVVAAFHVALGCVEPDLERRPRMKAVADSLDKIGS